MCVKNFNNQTKVSKRLRVVSILLLCLTIAAGVTYYFRDYLLLKYTNAKYNPFKPGDKLYAEKWTSDDKKRYNINLYRVVRPVNSNDVDAMNITELEKAIYKNNLSSSDKPYLTECAWVISSDSLRKYKTGFLGIYRGVKIMYEKFNGKYYPMNFYIISPHQKVLIKENISLYNVPSGYVWDDDAPFYISIFDVVNQENKKFK